MDVQLTALGTSVGILFALFFFARRTLSFRREDLLILGLGLLSLVYVSPGAAFKDLPATLRACGQIAMAFPVYFAVRNLYQYMSPRVFVGVVALYCRALFLQMWLPSIYASTFAHMLSDTRWFADEGRGPNGLCTEPSMMGNICILFIVSLYFFHREYWKSHRNAAYFVVVASCVMLVITKSGTGAVLALVVALAALLSSRLSMVAKCAILGKSLLVTVPVAGSLGASDSRGASVLSGVASNPLWILGQYSFADRLLGLYVGLHQISSQPFGSFDVQIDPDATDRALDGDVAVHVWPDSSFRSLLSDLRALRDDNHGAGAVVERMGILGVLIILLLMFYPRGFHGKWVVRAYIVGILLNASLFISTLWLVIGCCAEFKLQSTDSDTSRRHAPSIRKGLNTKFEPSRR